MLAVFAGLLFCTSSAAQPGDTAAAIMLLREKGFTQRWIDSFAKDEGPRWYSGEELKYIGQPVGGLYAGQLYLGGDGRLWYWDIFNQNILPWYGPGDKYYNTPMLPDDFRSVSSGFLVEIDGQVAVLDGRGFNQVRFRGEYPIARVRLSGSTKPISVELEAFSPFSPTESQLSSMPATLMCYTFTNTSDRAVELQSGGWLENATNRRAIREGKLHPHSATLNGLTGVLLSARTEANSQPTEESADSGTMGLALLNHEGVAFATNDVPQTWQSALQRTADAIPEGAAVVRSEAVALAPGESTEIRFAIAWHFANGHLGSIFPGEITRRNEQRHYYSKSYGNAGEVIDHLAQHHDKLVAITRLWRDTWYDSTLPTWFLDRTFLSASTLATNVAFRLHDSERQDLDGRVYFWEGVYLGEGTCTHVTHYEQAFGRLFPISARAQRQVTDFNAAWDDDLGYVRYRAESSIGKHFGIPHAIDGHAGTILRTYREHTTCSDDTFLRTVWPRVKRATQFMIDQDAGRGFFADKVPVQARNTDPDGILEGPQYNTLDKVWDGVVPWTSGLYMASLRAATEMARDMGDLDFANECTRIVDNGGPTLFDRTYNKDFGYFVQRPHHPQEFVNSNNGCHLDQVFGDAWAGQVGLKQILPAAERRSALEKIVEHNLYAQVGDYRKDAMIPARRFYADDDEPGLIFCTFPHGGEKTSALSSGNEWDGLIVGYFSECWTGPDYLVAAQMFDLDMPTYGLAVARAIHDRYAEAPKKRNPFSEVEYGNHYTRAMSSYAAYISATGFEYHGPKGHIGFAPKLDASNFRGAFTASDGWGTYEQQVVEDRLVCKLLIRQGEIALKSFSGVLPDVLEGKEVVSVEVQRKMNEKFNQNGNEISVTFGREVRLAPEQALTVFFNCE